MLDDTLSPTVSEGSIQRDVRANVDAPSVQHTTFQPCSRLTHRRPIFFPTRTRSPYRTLSPQVSSSFLHVYEQLNTDLVHLDRSTGMFLRDSGWKRTKLRAESRGSPLTSAPGTGRRFRLAQVDVRRPSSSVAFLRCLRVSSSPVESLLTFAVHGRIHITHRPRSAPFRERAQRTVGET